MKPNLYLFDLDGTLADRDSDEPYKDVIARFERGFHPASAFELITNQGGVALRKNMEAGSWGIPSTYPTEDQVIERIAKVVTRLTGSRDGMGWNISFNYQMSDGRWAVEYDEITVPPSYNPDRRKPDIGMVRSALMHCGFPSGIIKYGRVFLIGDRDEDRACAENASRHFGFEICYMHRDEFFAHGEEL